ncbi:MAG: hypothetical protein KDL87_09680 [Verrucomicrobiae bacterium]|nr:hypothetical protein [Verrucomicrobiae bacterium]
MSDTGSARTPVCKGPNSDTITRGIHGQRKSRQVSGRFAIDIVSSLNPSSAIPGKNAHLAGIIAVAVVEVGTDSESAAVG